MNYIVNVLGPRSDVMVITEAFKESLKSRGLARLIGNITFKGVLFYESGFEPRMTLYALEDDKVRNGISHTCIPRLEDAPEILSDAAEKLKEYDKACDYPIPYVGDPWKGEPDDKKAAALRLRGFDVTSETLEESVVLYTFNGRKSS